MPHLAPTRHSGRALARPVNFDTPPPRLLIVENTLD